VLVVAGVGVEVAQFQRGADDFAEAWASSIRRRSTPAAPSEASYINQAGVTPAGQRFTGEFGVFEVVPEEIRAWLSRSASE